MTASLDLIECLLALGYKPLLLVATPKGVFVLLRTLKRVLVLFHIQFIHCYIVLFLVLDERAPARDRTTARS